MKIRKIRVFGQEQTDISNEIVQEEIKDNSHIIDVLQRIAKGAIYVLIFLFPLFFLPWTINILDFNKQALLLVLTFISLICWLTSCLISNKTQINTNFLNIPIIVLLFINWISFIFSVSKYDSFWGLPQNISSGFVSFLCLILFYFVISNLFKKKDIFSIFLTIFSSSVFVAIFFILQIFGKFILPFNFTKNISFNTVGSINSLSIFFAILLILLLPLFFCSKKKLKIILGFFGLIFLITLFLINFKVSWVILFLGTLVLFIFGAFINTKINKKFTFLTMIFLAIALFFILFNFSFPGVSSFTENTLSQKYGFKIITHLPIKFLIIGSGPGTFVYDWQKYKTIDTNQNINWGLNFYQGPSEFLDKIITTGILGILALFFFIYIFLKQGSISLVRTIPLITEKTSEWFSILGIFAGFIGLIVSFLFYPTNLTLLFLFWLIIGCFSILQFDNEQKNSIFFAGIWQKIFKENEIVASIKFLIFSFVFILVLVFEFGFLFLYSQKYISEIKYVQGIQFWQKGNNDAGIKYISQAIKINPENYLYYRDLSQVYLLKLNEVIAKTDVSQQEKQSIFNLVTNSIDKSISLNPVNVDNWITRGFIYRSVIGIAPEAENLAIKSYQKAIDLNPTNPYIFTQLGLVYLNKQQIDKQEENIKLAKQNFEKAISLKSDYNFAYYQLGYLYYISNQYDNAKTQFEKAISIDPAFSNSRYFLGLIYDKQGDKKSAIEQFEIIERFNPENKEVKKILSNLREGKEAFEGLK